MLNYTIYLYTMIMDKIIIYTGIMAGSLIGAYLPVMLFGASAFDIVSLVGGVIGSFIGLAVGFKIYQSLAL